MSRPAVFSLLWCFPSFGAAWILAMDARLWAWGAGTLGMLASVRFEDWVAILLLGVHGHWVRQWLRARKPGAGGPGPTPR
jgi:hypothetical protein